VLPGEAYLADTPVLRAHAGTQPDLFLRWNAVARSAAAIDVVVHLHGFSQQDGAMLLAEKVPRSGLDLSGRARPTLALLPRGNWIRHTYYDFPALLDGGIGRLVGFGVERFADIIGKPGSGASIGSFCRRIPAAHAGDRCDRRRGTAARRALHLRWLVRPRPEARRRYMQGLEIVDRWLGERLAREPERPGALRVLYLERQTGLVLARRRRGDRAPPATGRAGPGASISRDAIGWSLPACRMVILR
jgi:hypothetical protein